MNIQAYIHEYKIISTLFNVICSRQRERVSKFVVDRGREFQNVLLIVHRLCKTEYGPEKCRNLWLDIRTLEIQLFIGGVIPDVAENRHVVIMLRCEHHVPEHVRCSNTALRTTNVLTNKHFCFRVLFWEEAVGLLLVSRASV
jgi:hypothetical protein